MPFFSSTKKLILDIDEFFNSVDQASLIFKEGINNYIKNGNTRFSENLDNITAVENLADEIRRKIENNLYMHSLLPEYRSDVLRLLKKCDVIIDKIRDCLLNFHSELPKIPKRLHSDIIKLAKIASSAINSLVPASRAFFTDPIAVKDKIHRVYFFEKEADKLVQHIKKTLFQEIENIDLSQKAHLRHFVHNICSVANAAENAADIVSIMAIKRIV